MSPRGDFSVCEHCLKPGHLALFRVAIPIAGVSRNNAPMVTTSAKALCVACGAMFRLPRWFDSAPVALAVVA